MTKYLAIILAAIFFSGGASARHGASQNWYVDKDGWTNWVGTVGTTGSCPVNGGHTGTYNGSCIVRVANAGSDGTCKPVPITSSINLADVCATAIFATTMLRTNHDDALLLNKGDTWTDQYFASWNGGSTPGSALFCLNGPSPYRVMLMGSYGSGARPLLKHSTPLSTSFYAIYTTGGCSKTVADNTFWMDWEWYAFQRDPIGNPGAYVQPVAFVELEPMFLLSNTNFTLIENWKISFYTATSVQCFLCFGNGISNNVWYRRNVIVDNWEPSPDDGQGTYNSDTNGLVFYQNVFDHNGWNASPSAVGGQENALSHNIYNAGWEPAGGSQSGTIPQAALTGVAPTNGTYTENIYANDSGGNQHRNGHYSTNNLYVHNAVGPLFAAPQAGGSFSKHDVILEGADYVTTTGHFGWGFNTMANYSGDPYNLGPITVQDMITANTLTTSGNGFGFKLQNGSDNVSITNSVFCNWQIATGVQSTGSPTQIKNLVGGSGYVDGTYSQPTTSYVTSGAGSGLAPYVVVSGGQVTRVNIYGIPNAGIAASQGSGYSVNDSLTITNSQLGGSGSGFSFQIASVAVNTTSGNTTKTADCSGFGFPNPSPVNQLTGAYDAAIGGTGTTADFLTRARALSRDNWDVRLTAGAHNAWARVNGFGLSAFPYNQPPFQ